MKGWKIAVAVILVVLVGIQWVPTHSNQKNTDQGKDFLTMYAPPARIGTLLRTACYDCHSNHTVYPWYNMVQPVAMFMENHIVQGKKKLNLSEFGGYSSRRQRSKLKSMASQIEDGDMPLTSYTLLHRNADLSDQERRTIKAWIDTKI
ncbi:heme-binding domain-containing protein [Persicitalea jodogahamensis]|uniref:Heme-binding protein n=1 Tax=Persicitalea jodogahamensis TaxID=402147 RepID=A0A8J3DDY9_9BACT|nr:heme-binding domain-containing protein [Persicitalea jodogahamensis]GHB87633.1 heme-binding protein [Persicitalea jodogahamensis]